MGRTPLQPVTEARGALGGVSYPAPEHPPLGPPFQGLTLHAQPIGAVLGVKQSPAAVSASVLGWGRHALAAAPVGTLSAAG